MAFLCAAFRSCGIGIGFGGGVSVFRFSLHFWHGGKIFGGIFFGFGGGFGIGIEKQAKKAAVKTAAANYLEFV